MMTSIWEKENSLAQKFWQNGIVPDCPIYDMHGHMGPYGAIYFKRNSPEDVVKHLRRIGVKRLVFSHHEALFGLFPNAKVVEMCKAHPDILRMYIQINPHHPEQIKKDLALFDQWQPWAFGLKILPDYHKVPANDKLFEYSLKFADERKLPVLSHTWGYSPYDGGKVMLDAAQKYPNVKFFMAHAVYNEVEYEKRLINETNGNVWMELTAVPGNFGHVERLVQSVGSEKLLLGTDMPWFDEYQTVGGILSADITEDDMRNILYRNVENLFGTNW